MGQKPERKPRSDKGKQRIPNAQDDRNYSFRLNPHIEKEHRTIELLEQWLSQKDADGRPITLRSLIVGLALDYAGIANPSTTVDVGVLGLGELTSQLEDSLSQVESIIDRLNTLGVTQVKTSKQKGAVNSDYLANLKKALRGDE